MHQPFIKFLRVCCYSGKHYRFKVTWPSRNSWFHIRSRNINIKLKLVVCYKYKMYNLLGKEKEGAQRSMRQYWRKLKRDNIWDGSWKISWGTVEKEMLFQAGNIHNLIKGMARTLVYLWGVGSFITCLDLKVLLGDEAGNMLSLVFYRSWKIC